jgi:hypothetical protein
MDNIKSDFQATYKVGLNGAIITDTAIPPYTEHT